MRHALQVDGALGEGEEQNLAPLPAEAGAKVYITGRRQAELDKAVVALGGTVVGTTGIPLGTADMTPFLSKIQGEFDGLFGEGCGCPRLRLSLRRIEEEEGRPRT